jgi:hypothetical protein
MSFMRVSAGMGGSVTPARIEKSLWEGRLGPIRGGTPLPHTAAPTGRRSNK